MKKHCLFCQEIVEMEQIGEYDRFKGCMCSHDSYYNLLSDDYSAIQDYPYDQKNKLFPYISAYIRERVDQGESVSLSLADVQELAVHNKAPSTVEEKETRLLLYLRGRVTGHGEPVNLYPLDRQYNLIASSNLQEFVYVIERLRDSERIDRIGNVLRLTSKGWREAEAMREQAESSKGGAAEGAETALREVGTDE
ncbi:hypothetical protein [Paenibacillus sp. HB172176]|uniref:hypothetical protein n=1 Tax=Paenibacillus sp. HB172176 TaxID=2493690 RepID=UPI00143B824F|nr:hypothetical protein [Paenibacillus sp. HB172176]